MKKGILWTILIVLVILAALIIATARVCKRIKTPKLVLGGAELRPYGPQSPPYELQHSHPIGNALHEYSRSLGPSHSVGVHPLDRNRYEPLDTVHGGGKSLQFITVNRKDSKTPPPKKPWTEYETWEALQEDEGASAAYFEQRAMVLDNPNINWGPVLAEMLPKLKENREYIGIANLDKDGKTLRLVASEASPLHADDIKSEMTFASIPGELVAKYASRPGLFLFHTHPADPRGSPLPSSHDLAAAIYFGATARFAACAVISRYGVLVHGLAWSAYKAINEAKDWKLALLNLSHDVVAAHEAVRSWSPYKISDYIDFYPRHRLIMYVYPSPEMVGDMHNYTFLWDLELPIDHELITEHAKDISDHRSTTKKKSFSSKSSTFSSEMVGAPLQFD